MKYLKISILLIYVFSQGACTSSRATLKTYIDPSTDPSKVNTVAIFQMRNTAFSPGETIEMDRAITMAFKQKNSTLKSIGTTDASKLLNDANLASEYSAFLVDFENSGIPNTVFLKKLKDQFDIDAILQGKLYDVKQQDKTNMGFSSIPGQTSCTIRYTILSTNSGKILWEGTSNAVKSTGKKFAPPIYEVASMAQAKIISSIPSLGK